MPKGLAPLKLIWENGNRTEGSSLEFGDELETLFGIGSFILNGSTSKQQALDTPKSAYGKE